MTAKQLKCKETGKMKHVSRCMRKNCSNLVVAISRTEDWRLAIPDLLKTEMKTKFRCMPE